jgi:mRNA-degrading endonuclease RelE of RelBE toxin-antitoxin system
VYLAWQVIPVMIRVYAFEDKVKEDCKYLHGRTLDDLKDDILEYAEQENMPIEKEDIQAAKSQIELHENLRVRIGYTVPITTPFYVYNWDRDFVYDAPSFE